MNDNRGPNDAGVSPWRSSQLIPGRDLTDQQAVTLVVADLHNHSLHSDGRGDPERAFDLMRQAGLDVAALTDHASIPHADVAGLSLDHYPDPYALALGRLAPHSFSAAQWQRTGELADAHDVPGSFTALRGFEWTEPWLGHANVWFSDSFTPVTTAGSMTSLFSFLETDAPNALFGYNHPGREPGSFDRFALPAPPFSADALQPRMVALEAFNRSDDFLFVGFGTKNSAGSPIVACLDAGWRPALIGCSDEHGRSYGLIGKGRTGLWVHEHSRAGVREALTARRAFATREAGLRLDASLGGARMGSDVRHPNRDTRAGARGGGLELAVDLAVDPAVSAARSSYAHAIVELQLFTGGGPHSGGQVVVLHQEPAVVGAVTRCTVTIPPDVGWVALRVADPGRGHGSAAPAGHPCATWALAYASPWTLTDGGPAENWSET